MSEKPGDHEASFEERLAMARDKQGLDAARPGPGKTSDGLDGNALAMGLRVGVELVSALVVAVAIGWGLDRLLGTTPILLAVFVLLGGAAGVLNVWRLYGPQRHVAPGRHGSVDGARVIGGRVNKGRDRDAGDRDVGDRDVGDEGVGGKGVGGKGVGGKGVDDEGVDDEGVDGVGVDDEGVDDEGVDGVGGKDRGR